MPSAASPPAFLQRLWFPASSGLGFNYLNCNATGETEAGNPPGDAPAASLHPRPAGGFPGWGTSGSPHLAKNPPCLRGLGGLRPGSIRALCPLLPAPREAQPQGGEQGLHPR